jgi:hypothetical protein
MGFDLLSGIGAAAGLLGSITGNRNGQRMSEEGDANIRKGLNTSQNIYYNMLRDVQDAEAAGVFNPDIQNRVLQDMVSHSLRKGLGNVAAQRMAGGYKPGDSIVNQDSRRMSEGASLQLRQQLVDNARMYRDMRTQAYQNAYGFGNQYANMASGIGNGQYARGEAMQQANNPGAYLGTLAAGGFFKSDQKK